VCFKVVAHSLDQHISVDQAQHPFDTLLLSFEVGILLFNLINFHSIQLPLYHIEFSPGDLVLLELILPQFS